MPAHCLCRIIFVALVLFDQSYGVANTCEMIFAKSFGAKVSNPQFDWNRYRDMMARLQRGEVVEDVIRRGGLGPSEALAIGDFVSKTTYFRDSIVTLGELKFSEPVFLFRPQVFTIHLLEGKLAGMPYNLRLPMVRLRKLQDVNGSRVSGWRNNRIITPIEFSTNVDQFYTGLYTLALHMRSLVAYQRTRDFYTGRFFSIERLKPRNWRSIRVYNGITESSQGLFEFLSGLSEHATNSAPRLNHLGRELHVSSNLVWVLFMELSWRTFFGFFTDPVRSAPRDMQSLRSLVENGYRSPVSWALIERIFPHYFLGTVLRPLTVVATVAFSLMVYEYIVYEIELAQITRENVAATEEHMRGHFDPGAPEVAADFRFMRTIIEGSLYE